MGIARYRETARFVVVARLVEHAVRPPSRCCLNASVTVVELGGNRRRRHSRRIFDRADAIFFRRAVKQPNLACGAQFGMPHHFPRLPWRQIDARLPIHGGLALGPGLDRTHDSDPAIHPRPVDGAFMVLVMMAVIAFERDAVTRICVHKFPCCACGVLPRCIPPQPRASRVWSTAGTRVVVQVPARIAPNRRVGPHRVARATFPTLGLKHDLPLPRSLRRVSGGRSLGFLRREL